MLITLNENGYRYHFVYNWFLTPFSKKNHEGQILS